MAENFTATAGITIDALPSAVWEALTEPSLISRYMFGTEVHTTWKVGDPITYRGEWEGSAYEDKGTILEVQPGKLLKSTHFSPLSGEADVPENYHTVTYILSEVSGQTRVTLTQDNNPSPDAAEHSRQNWELMLAGLKDVVEHR
ncbi:MAG: hypothetical protein QOH55_620 [Microbacteriaceae bacterium]|nr:hypothetical protein [Microbacteriaceae bacterium]